MPAMISIVPSQIGAAHLDSVLHLTFFIVVSSTPCVDPALRAHPARVAGQVIVALAAAGIGGLAVPRPEAESRFRCYFNVAIFLVGAASRNRIMDSY